MKKQYILYSISYNITRKVFVKQYVNNNIIFQRIQNNIFIKIKPSALYSIYLLENNKIIDKLIKLIIIHIVGWYVSKIYFIVCKTLNVYHIKKIHKT